MKRILLHGSTFSYLAIITFAALISSFVIGYFKNRGMQFGLPFEFYFFESNPSKNYGANFSLGNLILDLIIYYLLALIIAYFTIDKEE